MSQSLTNWILRITCLFWLIAKLISYKVWFTARVFPVVPVFNGLDHVPSFVHGGLYFLSLLLLVVVVSKPSNKYFIIALIISELCSCLLDYTRWQPWEYQ